MKYFYSCLPAFFAICVSAQTFTNSSNLIPGTYHSGGVTGVVDMNNDGRDDIIIMDESKDLHIAYQQANGTFTVSSFGTVSNEEQWGMCVGDIDNDGHSDVMCGAGYDGVHLININSPSTYTSGNLADASIFMQACNFADINNDGWLDAFACHDDGESFIFKNNGSGTLVDGNDLIDYTIHPDSDNSGNYGSVWCDFDRDGDIDCMVAKCRQFVNNPLDPRRTNILLVNNGNNVYHDEALERGLVNLQQSWTTDFADIDNDGDFDCLLSTHSGTMELYENDGFGYFTNITAGSGLEISGFFLQVKMQDFDNDGFVDVLYAGGVQGSLHNNGDHTFTELNNLASYDILHSFGIGDLNNDGWMDFYASYGDQYVTPDPAHSDRLYLNNGGSNHWIGFDLQGTASNKSAVGAIVEIHGPWGVQVREVRAGESYGISNSFMPHFGIGTATAVTYAVIHWPAGGKKVIESPAIDMVHAVTESNCIPPSGVITANGNTSICPGGSVGLSAAAPGNEFVWNNGASAANLNATEQGQYMVYVYNNTGCASASNVINVNVVEMEQATITIEGETTFCEGSSVELVANNGQSYTWSNGSHDQTITVLESGSYSVAVQGLCSQVTSLPVEVEVFDAPDAPVVDDISIASAGSVTFNYNGIDVRWYDNADAVVPVATGNNFTTPFVGSTTSFWVEDVMMHGGVEGEGGKMTKESTSFGNYGSSSEYFLVFDAHEDVVIQSVKVYASSSGSRVIDVVDASNEVVVSATFTVLEGESVIDLNFTVPAGEGYGLRCSSNNPQLWRDRNLMEDEPFDYPYDINGLVTITSTSLTGNNSDNYYYFFYDWKVESVSFECPSPRTEVQVIVTGIDELNNFSHVLFYPNPASELLNVILESDSRGSLNVRVTDQTGRLIAADRWSYTNGSNNYELNVSGFSAGLYQLQMEQEGKMIVQRFVVE